MPTAPHAEQLRLIVLQGHDVHLAQLAHRRATLPQLETLAQAEAAYRQRDGIHIGAATRATDVGRDLAKAERDVEQVRERAARDAKRLESAAVGAKDALALTIEIDLLAKRQADLEDVQLGLMEAKEAADAEVAAAAAALAESKQLIMGLRAEIGDAQAQIDTETELARAERAGAAAGIGPELTALYEKIRATRSGLGAAMLVGNRCDGCRMELNPVDLARIKALGRDEVGRCEECGRILVRA